MKRIISALLSATLLAGVAAMPAAAAETYSLGDVNMDGMVDSGDAVEVLVDYTTAMLFHNCEPGFSAVDKEGHSLNDEQLVLADVHPNGYIDGGDCILILQYYVYCIIHGHDISIEEFYANFEQYFYEQEQSGEVADQVIDEAYDYLHETN